MTRLKLAVLAAFLALALLAPAQADARPPNGKYYCYYFKTSAVPPYVDTLILKSKTKYKTISGGKGKYKYRKKKIKFKSGPYKGWKGKYKKVKGDHVINVYNSRGYVMTCTK